MIVGYCKNNNEKLKHIQLSYLLQEKRTVKCKSLIIYVIFSPY